MIVPFVNGFLRKSGERETTAIRYFLPDVRVAAAEFYVTNMVGDESGAACGFIRRPRIRDCGRFPAGSSRLQVDGYLAIQTDATPPLVMDEAHVPRDIFAVVREAPSGGCDHSCKCGRTARSIAR